MCHTCTDVGCVCLHSPAEHITGPSMLHGSVELYRKVYAGEGHHPRFHIHLAKELCGCCHAKATLLLFCATR